MRWLSSLHHAFVDGRERLGASVRLRLRADLEAPIRKVFLRSAPEGEQVMTEASRVADGPVSQWWEASVNLTVPRFAYRFLVLTDEGGWWLNAAGPCRHTPPDAADFKLLPGFHGPDWVQDAVFYQIFPDRFCDGDPASNVRTGEYLLDGEPVVARAWGEPPRAETASREFYGGDLPGIVQRLDYLEELGVTALYLNPIFTAPSNHKYDVADYGQVDPHLGGDRALAELRRAASERGLRVVLDVVPNHCGEEHAWFRRALADAGAPEAEFFTFQEHPDRYEAWLGVRSLPKLNYRSARLRELMLSGEGAVLRKWLRRPYSIDGWRIDVANMLARQGENQLGHKIGRMMRRAVKAENPDAYLVGEHFFDGTPHLQGDELDASMNYRGFTMPLLQWLGGFDNAAFGGKPWGDPAPLPTEALEAQWTAFRSGLPQRVQLQQMNLLDSHDMPRVLTAAGGDEERVRVAVGLLFAYPGVPCVFYGDEVGLAGGRDPDCRRTMPWDPSRWNLGLREHYLRMIRLRRASVALRRGSYQTLLARESTLAFQREAEGERVVVVARRGPDGVTRIPVRPGGIPDGMRFRGVLSGAEVAVSGGSLPATPGVELWRSLD